MLKVRGLTQCYGPRVALKALSPLVVLGTLALCFTLACWGYDPRRGFGALAQRSAP